MLAVDRGLAEYPSLQLFDRQPEQRLSRARSSLNNADLNHQIHHRPCIDPTERLNSSEVQDGGTISDCSPSASTLDAIFRSTDEASPCTQLDNCYPTDTPNLPTSRSAGRINARNHPINSNAEGEIAASPRSDFLVRRAAGNTDPDQGLDPTGRQDGRASSPLQSRRPSPRAAIACVCRDSFGRI